MASSFPSPTLGKILGNGKWFPIDYKECLHGPVPPPSVGPQPSAPPTPPISKESALGSSPLRPPSSIKKLCDCLGPPGLSRSVHSQLPTSGRRSQKGEVELGTPPRDAVDSCRQSWSPESGMFFMPQSGLHQLRKSGFISRPR